MKRTNIFSIFLSLLFLMLSTTFSQSKCSGKEEIEYIPGELFLKLTNNEFNLPLEIYGVKVSFSDANSELMNIDSLKTIEFKPNSRVIVQEHTYEYNSFREKSPEITKKAHVQFSKNIIQLFKKYAVYFIRRRAKTFSPTDTLEHIITSRRQGSKKTKSPNYNKSLFIKFNEKTKTKEFLEELKKLKSISNAQLSEKVMEFSIPNDTWYKKDDAEIEQRDYLGSNIMNFEGAWDIIKGDDDPYNLITIAFIDSDFDNLYNISDLDANINGNGPYFYGGSGSGHGVAISSIACAETNNDQLIAGATYNSKFMPFLWTSQTSQTDIFDALTQIKDYQDDWDVENDCFVVNMSFGYASIDTDIESRCNELYNDYGVLLVAAVGNYGTADVMYPAGHSSVIGVGAMAKSDDQLISDSNWGNNVEVVATGENIFYLQQWFDYWDLGRGTSVAAPFVSSL